MQFKTDILEAIGNTPLIKLNKVSEETGCTILGKAEFLNPGQSVKDRAALSIVREAVDKGEIGPGGTIVEGTAGNTGIGLTLVANAMGFKSVIVIPQTQSQEKKDALRLLGAELVEVPAVPYKNPNNYVKYSARLAEKLAEERDGGAIWANQFDNTANRRAHSNGTAVEIWEQTDGKVDGFVSAVGSGGTLGGVSDGLKARNKDIKIVLADPMGSALYNYYKTGELKAEGSSITEGIGQGRVTENIADAMVDDAFQISDEEALEIVYDHAAARRPLPWRVIGHQHCRRGAPGAGHGPRTHDRDAAVRLREPVSVEDVQSGVPEGKRPAGAGVAVEEI